MSVEKIIVALEHANALRATQRYLTRAGLGSGRNWTDITESVNGHIGKKKLKEADLYEFLIDVQSRARKLVSLYDLSAKKKTHKALLLMAKESVDNVADAHGFPYVLSKKKLDALEETPLHVHTRATTDGYEMFFTSARLGVSTDPIPIENIIKDKREQYSDAARMLVERIVRQQAFDVIFIPYEPGLAQIRIDTGGISAKDRNGVRVILEQIVLSTSKIASVKFNAVDLFPAVTSIYDDDDEGRVTGIHFNYAEGSLTHLKKKTAKGQKDLRKDPFHTGGKAKVQRKHIIVYWLAVELEEDSSSPDLVDVTLPGQVRNALKRQPLLAFEVPGFASEGALAYAVGVIFKHARKNDDDEAVAA